MKKLFSLLQVKKKKSRQLGRFKKKKLHEDDGDDDFLGGMRV